MKERIVSSLIGIPLIILVVYLGGLYIDIAWYAVVLILIVELVSMVFQKLEVPVLIPAIIYLSVSFIAVLKGYNLDLLLLAFYLITSLILNLIIFRKHNIHAITLFLSSTIYIVTLGKYLLLLSRINIRVLIFSFLVAWSYDSFAYFIGKTWGKRRPWPDLSPKKSVEGVIGGICGSVLIAFIYGQYNQWNILVVITYAFVAAFLAQSGDLIESAIKRTCNVKDSGKILPGHGGLLDRFDSVLPVLPWTFLIFGLLKL